MDHLELFNAQIRVLKKSDYSHLLVRKLEEQQIEVLAAVNKRTILEGQTPFLPVPTTAIIFSKIANRPTRARSNVSSIIFKDKPGNAPPNLTSS